MNVGLIAASLPVLLPLWRHILQNAPDIYLRVISAIRSSLSPRHHSGSQPSSPPRDAVLQTTTPQLEPTTDRSRGNRWYNFPRSLATNRTGTREGSRLASLPSARWHNGPLDDVHHNTSETTVVSLGGTRWVGKPEWRAEESPAQPVETDERDLRREASKVETLRGSCRKMDVVGRG